MKLPYKISDFCISNADIPKQIADRILEFHLLPMTNTSYHVGFDIYPSYSTKGQPSGYRPYVWEIARGRSGKSQHTFGQRKSIILNEKGACDITCDDFKNNKDCLLEALIEHTDYTRFAVYDTFYHNDYRNKDDYCYIYKSNSKSQWKLLYKFKNTLNGRMEAIKELPRLLSI